MFVALLHTQMHVANLPAWVRYTNTHAITRRAADLQYDYFCLGEEISPVVMKS